MQNIVERNEHEDKKPDGIVADEHVPADSLNNRSATDAPVTTLRLSEAIRLGAMLKPQAFGTWFDGEGTCALGAAIDALGITESNVLLLAQTIVGRARCPVCGCDGAQFHLVPHLNDDHHWTRERIADWVEQQEQSIGGAK